MPQLISPGSVAYLFLDEGGNLDFSPSGTKYFTMTSVLACRPFEFEARLSAVKLDLIEQGLPIEYFHATEDRQAVRDAVFAAMSPSLSCLRADSIIVEKRKTGPSVRADVRFYPQILGHLLPYVIRGEGLDRCSRLILITDRLPIHKKRSVVEGAIKHQLGRVLPHVAYTVLHHDSKSCWGLQVADYVNWAVYRSWDKDDTRSLDLIRPMVHSQFDVFRRGEILWY